MTVRSLLLAGALAALAAGPRPVFSQQTPHPAVVRVIVAEKGGASFGSGALVAVHESNGLVATNWHVVCEAAGPVSVTFPGGFRSQATVLAANRDWDLAALLIERPPGVEPIPLAIAPPRPGDVLWIAGYGQGAYRASAGRCTQYVAPGRNLPFEMVELSAAARKGDSGGPILNAQGELAGVLFGTGRGRTAGSYCGRVRWFLDSLDARFEELAPRNEMIAQRRPRTATTRQPGDRPHRWSADLPPLTPRVAGQGAKPQAAAPAPVASLGRVRAVPDDGEKPAGADPAGTGPVAAGPLNAEQAPAQDPPSLAPVRSEQIKTFLAAIGLLAIAFHGVKVLLAAAK